MTNSHSDRTPASGTDTRAVNGPELTESRGNPAQPSAPYKIVGMVRRIVVNRPSLILLAVVVAVVAASLAVPVPAESGIPGTGASGTGVSEAGSSGSVGPGEPNETASAGEHLAGSLGSHQESVDRNLSQRTLVQRLARASNDTERARNLAIECERLDERLAELRERARRLERARENGSMSAGEFRARMTRLDAKAESVAERVGSCSHEAEKLPEDALGAADFNASLLQEVGERVTSFREADLANRTFEATWIEQRDDRPDAPPENVSRERREALVEASAEHSFLQERYEHAKRYVEDVAPGDEQAAEQLSCARDHLDAAEQELAAAREAASEDDDERFQARIEAARKHLEDAERCIEGAYEEAGS